MIVYDAVEMLMEVRGDLVLAARGIEVDQDELAAAIAENPVDSAEAVVMRLLVRQPTAVPPPPEE